MHHRIMVRSERESTNEIARFWLLKLPIPAISNASPAEKQTPAQSLRGLFTDDVITDLRYGNLDVRFQMQRNVVHRGIAAWPTARSSASVSRAGRRCRYRTSD